MSTNLLCLTDSESQFQACHIMPKFHGCLDPSLYWNCTLCLESSDSANAWPEVNICYYIATNLLDRNLHGKTIISKIIIIIEKQAIVIIVLEETALCSILWSSVSPYSIIVKLLFTASGASTLKSLCHWPWSMVQELKFTNMATIIIAKRTNFSIDSIS